MTRCKYLTKKNLCGIYFDRPKICREYTTDDCEYDTNWIFEETSNPPNRSGNTPRRFSLLDGKSETRTPTCRS